MSDQEKAATWSRLGPEGRAHLAGGWPALLAAPVLVLRRLWRMPRDLKRLREVVAEDRRLAQKDKDQIDALKERIVWLETERARPLRALVDAIPLTPKGLTEFDHKIRRVRFLFGYGSVEMTLALFEDAAVQPRLAADMLAERASRVTHDAVHAEALRVFGEFSNAQ